MNYLLAFIGGCIFASVIWTLALAAGRSRYKPKHRIKPPEKSKDSTSPQEAETDCTRDCMWL